MSTRRVLRHSICGIAWFAFLNSAHAAALLRIDCFGDSQGAEVYVNRVFRGNCPIDTLANPGNVQLRVVKKIDERTERVYEEYFTLGDRSLKRVEPTLSAPQLNPEAVRREAEDRRVREAADAAALKRDQVAAQAGDAAAMLALANRFESGAGLAKDDVQAVAWLEKASSAGSTEAISALAHHYDKGIGTARNFSRAVELYSRAAEAGDAKAMMWMVLLHRLGLTGHMRDDIAKVWLQKAADAGNAAAMAKLGTELAFQAFYEKGDPAVALKWIRKAADMGSSEGVQGLATVARLGIGTAQDPSEALRLDRKAIELGISAARTGDPRVLAEVAIGLASLKAQLVASGRQDALGDPLMAEVQKWMQRAVEANLQWAQAGDPSSMITLTSLLQMQQRMEEALIWKRRAADAGCVAAMSMLGSTYGYGIGAAVNKPEARKWLRKAMEAGDDSVAPLLKLLDN